MGSKRVWPVCSDNKTVEGEGEVEVETEGGCYDWGSRSLVMNEGREGMRHADVEEWI